MTTNTLDISGLERTRSPAAVRSLSSTHRCLEDCGLAWTMLFFPVPLSLSSSHLFWGSLSLRPTALWVLRFLRLKTSMRLSAIRQTIHHPRRNAYIILFTRSIAVRLCHWFSIAVRLRKMHLRRKNLSSCDSVSIVPGTDHTKAKQIQHQWSGDKNETFGASRPKLPICILISE